MDHEAPKPSEEILAIAEKIGDMEELRKKQIKLQRELLFTLWMRDLAGGLSRDYDDIATYCLQGNRSKTFFVIRYKSGREDSRWRLDSLDYRFLRLLYEREHTRRSGIQDEVRSAVRRAEQKLGIQKENVGRSKY